jgi:GNAT superfamily N-acetyltransferase
VSDLVFSYLADHQELVPTLREWFEEEWAYYYGTDGPGNAEADLLSCCNKKRLPLALVAFKDGELCATGALKHESITTHKHLSPWVSALLVAPKFRGKGVGTQMVSKLERVGKDLGFHKLYAGTESAFGLFERNDWTFIERIPYSFCDVSIYEKVL